MATILLKRETSSYVFTCRLNNGGDGSLSIGLCKSTGSGGIKDVGLQRCRVDRRRVQDFVGF